MFTPAGRVRWPRLVALPMLTCLATACGNEANSPSGTPSFDARSVAAVEVPTSGSALVEVLDAARALSDVRGDLVARCLNAKGMPQALEAIAWSDDVDPRYVSSPLRIVPIDLGPSTKEEARRYGLVGSTIPIDADRAGYVVSRDDEFDRAADQCTSKVEEGVPLLDPVHERSVALQNQVRDEFVEQILDPLKEMVQARYRCIRDAGFPRLKPRVAAEAEDWASVLEQVGLETGEFEERAEAASSVKPGEVRAFPPAEEREYRADAGEVELAITFVECGDRMQFTEKLDTVSERARDRLSRLHSEAATRLSRDLERLSRQVRQYREQVDTP